MNFSSHFKPLGHAYLIEGNRVATEEALLSTLKKEYGITQQGNPDFWSGHFNTFTIEDAREIKEAASKKKMSEGKRVFIVSAESLTREASNALLKTLEEPGEETHFFIIMPSIKRILPTILSRVRLVKHESESEKGILEPKEFLKLSPGERIKKIKEFMSEVEKESISKADMNVFVEALLAYIYEQNPDKNLKKEAIAASYSRDISASVKMIVEYLALVA